MADRIDSRESETLDLETVIPERAEAWRSGIRTDDVRRVAAIVTGGRRSEQTSVSDRARAVSQFRDWFAADWKVASFLLFAEALEGSRPGGWKGCGELLTWMVEAGSEEDRPSPGVADTRRRLQVFLQTVRYEIMSSYPEVGALASRRFRSHFPDPSVLEGPLEAARYLDEEALSAYLWLVLDSLQAVEPLRFERTEPAAPISASAAAPL